jgi:Protein of unknown function DUF262
MMKKAPAAKFLSRHDVRLLEELFAELKRGELRSPPFVSPFRWSAGDMQELVDSVLGGYPIGAVVVWDPDERQMAQPHFGPISQENPGPEQGPLSYVIDGYQRMATLFGLTHIEGEAPESGNERCWWMAYDLDEEALIGAGPSEPHHLPLNQLLGTTAFLQFSARLQKARPADSSKLIPRAERVARLVRSYRLPVSRIRGGSLEEAIEIAARLNRRR